LAPLAALAQQQEGLITGKVTSDAGAPISGAQVYLDKMNLGTTTKEDGSYRIVIPAGRANGQAASLSVKLIGFKPKSVNVALKPSEQTMDFVLGAQAVVLQQVVITGEGIITTNEKLGETVNVVSGTAVANSNESNITNALSAKAPNVAIQSMSGDPGSSTSIQIRGIKTLSGTAQPLFVVDGVPLDNSTLSVEGPIFGSTANQSGVVAPNRISDVNPADIESVTILKGAAASAIYGARASQGVVLITTKSGKAGTTRYTFNTAYSANDVTQGYPLQTTYGQSFTCATTNCNAASRSWGAALAPGTTTYDHFKEMYVTGSTWDNVLGISGGDDKRSFYFSLGYNKNDGFVFGGQNSYDRVTVKVKGSQMLSDQMKVSVNLNYVNTWGNFVQRGDNVDGIMLGGLRTPPEFDNKVYLDPTSGLHRSYRFPNPGSNSLTIGRNFDNPFWVMTSVPATSNLSRVYGNMDLNWTPNDWLTFQWTPGVDYYTDQRSEAFPFTSSSNPVGGVNIADYTNFIVSSVITLVGSHTFNPNFSGTLTVGNEINSNNFQQNFIQGIGLIAPQPYKISNTISWAPNDDQALVHAQSYFAQATADLFDQLYLTAAIRNDGFSSFAQNNPRAWYPKASASWTFTKSVSPGNWLQFGKLRAAYGETGKPPTVYSPINVYTVGKYFEYGGLGYLNTVYQGIGGLNSTTALGTDSLRAERQTEYEAGLDLGFFNGMADFGFTYYNSNAKDVIIDLPLPPSSGAQSEPVNAARITNKGYEVTFNLNSKPSDKSISWNAGLVWGKNNNLVQSITGAAEVQIPNAIVAAVARPGYVTGSIEGKDFVRCGRGAEDVSNPTYAAACSGAPKNAMYIDATGFPVIDQTLQILGSYQPNWAMGIHGSVTFKQKLMFSFLVDIRNGGQAYNGTRGALLVYGTHKDTEIRGTMQTFGSANWHPGPVVGPGAGNAVLIDANWFQNDGGSFGDNTGDFVENSGFTKLREIAVQYTWDGKWVTHNVGLSSIAFRLAGRNLYTWTSYSGIDPEFNLEGAGNLVQGVDWFGNPQTRSLVFSIGLTK
jgi:TonB-linked SusC/RagA family outer membrane protein